MGKEPTDTTFHNHVILYAKGWYVKSNDTVEDLKKLLSKWCGMETQYISEDDIFEFMVDTFLRVIPDGNPDKPRWICEMLGKHWTSRMAGMQRKPEQVLLGAISTCDGHYCDITGIYTEFAKK